MSKIRIEHKYLNMLFSLSLLMLSMAAFLFLGADGYVLFDDSTSYIEFYNYSEGVMPVYPLFLYGNRLLFGEAVYLYAVIVEQAVFASCCILIFVQMIRKQFDLRYLECYCIFLLALLPFTTDMPEAMTTQEIVTEGIAYAAFYLFMAVLLKTVWTKRIRWMGLLVGTTLLLSATRSQLQMLFGVCGIIFFYIILMRPKKAEKKRWMQRILIGLAGCAVISLAGVWCVGRVNTTYQKIIKWNRNSIVDKEQAAEKEDTEVTTTDKAAETNDEKKPNVNATSQYVTLIFSKGMYEAEYDDYQLFEDVRQQELFQIYYRIVDKHESRYSYAEPGLWMWQDIVNGVGKIGPLCMGAQLKYYKELPEIYYSDAYGTIRNQDHLQIGLTLIKAHFGRVMYHMLLLLPQAFIFTVFFKIEEIYLLCHLVTLFMYVSALGLMIWAYKDKKIDSAYGEFMAAVLGVNTLMVVVISLIFFGHQRYLVYNFGIFYIIYFLLLLQLWKVYGKNRLLKWRRKR